MVLTDGHEDESSNNHEEHLKSISVDDSSQSTYSRTVIVRDSRTSRQKMVKKIRHTFVKIAKITAKSRQFI